MSQDLPYFILDECGTLDEPIPRIFNVQNLEEAVPPGFNAVRLLLDGRMDGDLEWKAVRKAAVRYMTRGLKLFWEIDFGFSQGLRLPLSDQTQFMALGLSLSHFQNTLWEEFRQHTIGVCLYRGSADCTRLYTWTSEEVKTLQDWLQRHLKEVSRLSALTGMTLKSFEEIDPVVLQRSRIGHHLMQLFCQDAIVEYLNLFAGRLPDGLTPFILLDISEITDPLFLMQRLSKERFDLLCRGVSDSILPIPALSQYSEKGLFGYMARDIQKIHPINSSLGICVPPISIYLNEKQPFQKAIEEILAQKLSFRAVSEDFLSSEWHGLDFILVDPDTISVQGTRKLRGFCAAGGTIVTTQGKSLGLSHEISFEQWLERNENLFSKTTLADELSQTFGNTII